MRRGIALFLLAVVCVLGLLVHQVWSLLALLVVDGRQDAIMKEDVPSSEFTEASPPDGQLIPKILHQTYKNASIPERWQGPQQSCIDLHSDWDYYLWTDDKAREFIAAEYTWFLETYDSYEYPIQRADAIRYFVLAHFGGVYLDLDDGCQRPLNPLLVYPAWLRRTLPTGISNDAMGAAPGHPFFLRVIKSLQRFNRQWPLPYLTVMASTGPLFLSVMWRDYNADGPIGNGRIRLIFPDEYNGHPWSFFTHHLGNSWHGKDVQLIFWMARNWMIVTALGFILGLTILLFVWQIYVRLLTLPGPKRYRLVRRIPRWRYSDYTHELADRRDV